VTDFFTSSRAPGPRGGRLQVRLAGGSTVVLLPYPMVGYRVHLLAADQLRHLLRLPSPAINEAAQIAAEYKAENG